MGDSGHGSPAHPSLASSRRKVEMIKQVKDKNKVVVVEVGEIVTLVEQCEAKTGDKEPKFLIKKKDGHKYKVKDSYFKEWVDPSIPPAPPPPPPPTADEIIDDLLPDLCDVAVWEAELDVRLETENFRKTDTAVCAMFEQIDANNDGVVTMRELTMALKRDRGLGKRLGLKLTGGEIHDKDGSREEIKEFFARHDVDDEAGLQLHEFYTALRPEGPPPPLPDHIASALPTDEDLEAVFAAVDPTEIVEEVQMREILDVLEKSPELQLAFGLKVPGGLGLDRGTNDVASRETYAQFLARWDREGDRTLSRAEFKGIFGRRYELRNPALVTQLTKRAMERDIGDLFAKIDKNHDGRVSKPELILALRRDEALALRLGLCKGAIRDDSRASLENFFAEFDADAFADAAELVLGDAPPIVERMTLEIRVESPDEDLDDDEGWTLALNDCVVTAGAPFRMIELGLDFNGHGGPHLSGDGLIVSTPTGSTAYNVSAGGPIVHPTCDALVVTPLAVHSLAFRPVVAGADETITVTAVRVNEGTTLVIDGQLTRHLRVGERVRLRRGAPRVRLIHDPRAEFWSTVVRKMRWATGPTYRDR